MEWKREFVFGLSVAVKKCNAEIFFLSRFALA